MRGRGARAATVRLHTGGARLRPRPRSVRQRLCAASCATYWAVGATASLARRAATDSRTASGLPPVPPSPPPPPPPPPPPSYPYAAYPHRQPLSKRHRCRGGRWTQHLLRGQLPPPPLGGRVGGRHCHAAPDGRRHCGGDGGCAPIHEWGGGEGNGGGRVHRDTAGAGGVSAAGALRQHSCGNAGPTHLECRWTGENSERAVTAHSPSPCSGRKAIEAEPRGGEKRSSILWPLRIHTFIALSSLLAQSWLTLWSTLAPSHHRSDFLHREPHGIPLLVTTKERGGPRMPCDVVFNS